METIVDIVERLQLAEKKEMWSAGWGEGAARLLADAADEIIRLRAECRELAKAVAQFAAVARVGEGNPSPLPRVAIGQLSERR